MSAKVLLATNNAKKLTELRRIVAEQGLDVEILSLRDVEAYPEPAETEWSFEGNALIKARAGFEHSGLATLRAVRRCAEPDARCPLVAVGRAATGRSGEP